MADKIKYTTQDAAFLNRQVGPRPDLGWAVNSPDISANDSKNWTVQLVKANKKYLNLWVEEADIDFSMSGTTGQSRYRREFYPHSFNEPTLVLKGRMPNQREYNKLAAFVRESHSEALNANVNYSEKSAGKKAYPTVSLIMRPHAPENRFPRTQKGGHRGMQLEGYIKSIAAGAQKFEFAPAFEIQFIVASSAVSSGIGIYQDDLDPGSQVVSWMSIFKDGYLGAKSGYQIKEAIGQSTPGYYINAAGESVIEQPKGAQINHRGVVPNDLSK
jgi:hypothetical protein